MRNVLFSCCALSLLPVEVGAAPDCVMAKVLLALLIAKVLQGVWPQEITHGSERWGLLKPIQLGHTETYSKEHTKYIHTHITPFFKKELKEGSTFFISSMVCISGDSPPWTHRNCWFMSAAKGRQSNASIQESYTCSEYLILPERKHQNREISEIFHPHRILIIYRNTSSKMQLSNQTVIW